MHSRFSLSLSLFSFTWEGKEGLYEYGEGLRRKTRREWEREGCYVPWKKGHIWPPTGFGISKLFVLSIHLSILYLSILLIFFLSLYLFMYILNVYQLDNICVFYIVYISPLCLNPFSLTSLFSQQFNAESKINAVTHQKRIKGQCSRIKKRR